MRAWLEMDRIVAIIPWPVWVLAILVWVILTLVRRSLKLRKQFGKATTLEEIRKVYPRAKLIKIPWPSKKSNPNSN
jgi:hypothetical protein